MRLASPEARGLHLGALVVVLAAVAVGLLGALDLAGADLGGLLTAVRWLTACPLAQSRGETCPLCGTIRALHRLLCLDVAGSLAANPLALGLTPLALSQIAYRGIRVLRPRFRLAEELALDGAGIGLATLALALALG